MSTDEKNNPASWLTVTSFADGSVRLHVELMPDRTADNVIDAAYAVLDEFSGANAIDPDAGKPPKPETVQ